MVLFRGVIFVVYTVSSSASADTPVKKIHTQRMIDNIFSSEVLGSQTLPLVKDNAYLDVVLPPPLCRPGEGCRWGGFDLESDHKIKIQYVGASKLSDNI